MSEDPKQRPLRMAYFTEWSPYEMSGVLKKMIGQIRAWRELGHEAKLFAISPHRNSAPAGDFAKFGETVGVIGQDRLIAYPFARLGYVNKVTSVATLARRIRAYAPDIIYYRQQGPWYPGLGTIMGIAPTVLEVNTIEAAEAPLWGALFAFWYRMIGMRAFGLADAMVCVTDEIAQAYAHFAKPVAVIANSLDKAATVLPPTDNPVPAFVFVGSSTVGPGGWHGVDKILDLARALPDCTFSIVGLDVADLGHISVPENVRLRGALHGSALTAVYRESDVAISTLALHRLGMEEACPLKTREYLMHGLPVIVGYREAEQGLRNVDYVLNIGNQENNIASSVAAIRAFAMRWRSRRVEADLEFLTSRFKAQQRIDLFNLVLSAKARA